MKTVFLMTLFLAIILTGSMVQGRVNAEKVYCKGIALCIVGKVKRIVDGDTLTIEKYKIRLSLTNTPEKKESGFKEAKMFTAKICPVGSTVTVDQDDIQRLDKYKRVLGKVICSGKVLNAELLYRGHANLLTQYCAKSEFSSEDWAQKYGCGKAVQKEQKPSIPPPPSPAPPTKPKEKKCEPSYPDVCIPPYPPDLDCGEIPYRNFRVLPPDPHGFDRDKDGIGCET